MQHFGAVGAGEGIYHAASTGDFSAAQDAFGGMALFGTMAWTLNELAPVSYRGEYPTLDPEKAFSDGLSARGSDMDLAVHADGNANSGYVPTSESLDVATSYAGGARGENGPVYEVKSWNGVEVSEALGTDSPNPNDEERAIPGGIDGSEITGYFLKEDGELTGTFVDNPYFGLNATTATLMGTGSLTHALVTPLGKKQ